MAERQKDHSCIVAIAGDPGGAACLAPVLQAIAASTDLELQACLGYLKGSLSYLRGLEDLLWGLLNTREFQLNH